MSCFWNAIIRETKQSQYKQYGYQKPKNANELIGFLKQNNTKCKGVTWNSEELTNQFLDECQQSIKEMHDRAENGYLCSSCEPVMILICYLFKMDIDHKYNGNLMKYRIRSPIGKLSFRSNKSHMH